MFKTMKHLLSLLLLSFLTTMTFSQSINGAWKRDLDTAVQYITIIDDYFSSATFSITDKKFINTRGGLQILQIINCRV